LPGAHSGIFDGRRATETILTRLPLRRHHGIPKSSRHAFRKSRLGEAEGDAMTRYLLHDNLLVRFPALLLADAVVLVASWLLAYLLLPEGLLAGRTGAAVLAGGDLAGGSVALEAVRLLAINLVVVVGAIIAPNLIRQGGYPLGYSALLVITAVFGVTIGTNSFAVSLGGKMPLSVEVFGSSGLYEIAAYALAAAATISIVRWKVVGSKAERVPPVTDRRAIRQRNAGTAVAMVMLVLACLFEAYRFSRAISA
jgi:hypothetical protein